MFFYPVWLKNLIPLPTDFIAGVYYPWHDYNWGYPTGVPVKNPITTDVVSLIYPEQMLGVDLLKKGEWPLWNPYILSGTPLLANLQTASFSPTIFVYFLFEKLTAWSIQIILQHILAAVFVYILLRYWKVSKLGSVFGGIAFSFSGFNLIFSEWNGHTLASAFIPLILYFEDRFLKKGGYINGIGLSFSLGFQLLAGYPQTTLYTGLAAGILWLVRFAARKEFFVKTVFLGLFFLLGFGIAGLELIPARELWSLSQRNYELIPYDGAFLPWKKIITFLAPDYFGNHATYNYWGPQDYTSNTGFVGVVAIIFTGLAIKFIKYKKEVLFLFIVAIFSLIISFPTPVSVFIWQHNIFDMGAASAHRGLILFNLSMSLLAGFGLDYFLTKKDFQFKWALVFPYLIIGAFGVVTLYLYINSRGTPAFFDRWIPKYLVGLRNLVLPFSVLFVTTVILSAARKFPKVKKVSAGCLLALMSFELFWFGWKFTPFSPRELAYPTTPIFQFLTDKEKPFRVTGNKITPVNLRTPYKLESPEGYETIHPLRISEFLAAVNSGGVGAQTFGRYGVVDNDVSRLLDVSNTKYYLTNKINTSGSIDPSGEIPERFKDDRFKVAFEDRSVAVMESKTVMPRAFVVYDWEIIKDRRKILEKLLEPNFPFRGKIVLEEDISGVGKIGSIGDTPETKYSLYSEQNSTITVKTSQDGLLFVSDTWYPGWKAFIDGEETKIYRADYVFRAIAIPAGQHNVSFIYSPNSFKIGLMVSGAALILLVSLFVFFRIYDKKFSLQS